jgi:hypothetical protein
VLGLVVVLGLNVWDFGAEKRARSFGDHFVPSTNREICRNLEHEQEHDF